jgi:hypothetical protein
VNGLQEEWQQSVRVIQVDVNRSQSQSLVEGYGGQFTPTFILFDTSGEEYWRSVGNIDPNEARRQIAELLKDS